MKKRIDEKHSLIGLCREDPSHQIDIAIIKTTNGVEIPADEPVILFRGRDRLALPMLAYYRQMCVMDGCNDFQLESMDRMIQAFQEFAAKSPTMKQPGITRGK